MDLGGAISKLLSLGAKLRPAVRASAHAPSSSSSPPVDENHQIEAELEKLMMMLERIKATLYDAEQKEIKDLSVKLWLKEIKRVAYDAEDVLDEYHYEVLRAQVEARDASPPDSHKMKLFHFQVPHGMLDQIQQIRSKFYEISNDRIALQLSEVDGPRRCNNELQIAQTSHFVVESNIFGREREKEKLIYLLSSERKRVSVVTVVGMGGIGKTTIAQLVYNDQRIRQRFDKFGWICVSKDFNVETLTKQLVESITGDKCDLTNLSALQDKIGQEISGKRVLVVLDDAWNDKKSLWDSFQVPFTLATFVKILVTTRNDYVAQIMQTEPTFNLGYLSAEQCWRLFQHYAFGGVQHNKGPNMVEIGKKIMNKCGLLPLAVKSIANFLRHEAEEESWRDILESELWECADVSNEIFSSLQISYARLPTYLKPCFLYCSMFPKNHWYDVRDMVKLWMCQGFIESQGNKTAEKIGFDYARQLCQRSLFEKQGIYEGYDFDWSFMLHDLVHDLARCNSENSCYSIKNSKLQNFPNVMYHLYIAHLDLIDPIPSDKFTTLRTLITGYSVKNFFSTFDFSMAPKLRALDIQESPICESEFLSSIGNLKHLCCLSLGYMSFKTLPEYICSLYNLQYLTLRNSDHLKELPTKIGNLISLKELIIDHYFDLKVLPESLCQLKALKKLSISGCYKIKKLPNNMGNLISLEELTIDDCHDLVVLPESLCQLKALKILFINNCYKIKELPNNIGNLISLEELTISFCDLAVLPGSVCQLKALRILDICGCYLLDELPSDMESLTNLQNLYISGTGLSYIPPSLSKFLEIRDWGNISRLRSFPHLGGALFICGLKWISNLTDVQCANLVSMHNLEHLILSWTDTYHRDIDCSVFQVDDTKSNDENIFLEDQSCLASLQPHPNLSKLEIEGYGGITFPEWIGSLCKLKYLKITFCDNLQFLKAESLPLELEELEIYECHKLISMPGIQKLKSLVKLSINNCQNLCSVMEPTLELTMCAWEVSSCLGLRQWCLQHGINYKDDN